MHIIESFALNSGLKIGKPYIYEKYFPLPFKGDYITLQPFGKYDSRKYDYWEEVLEILGPILQKNKIKVVRIGGDGEPEIFGTINLSGKTNYNQSAYIIKKAILHLGIDSFGVHIASGYDKKIVALYNVMSPSNSGPYWSKKEDVIILEPDRKPGEKCSYSPVENPKTINKIKPEKIAESVCKLLQINFDYSFKTVHVGKNFHNKKIELVPESSIKDLSQFKIPSLIVRMDVLFNEKVLTEQLNISPCSIVTKSPIDINLLSFFRGKIVELVFIIDKNSNVSYLKEVKKKGIKFFLIYKGTEEELNDLKLKYLDIEPIIFKEKDEELIKKIKEKDIKNMFFKSSSIFIIKDKIYMSSENNNDNVSLEKIRGNSPLPIIDKDFFWENIDDYIILEKS